MTTHSTTYETLRGMNPIVYNKMWAVPETYEMPMEELSSGHRVYEPALWLTDDIPEALVVLDIITREGYMNIFTGATTRSHLTSFISEASILGSYSGAHTRPEFAELRFPHPHKKMSIASEAILDLACVKAEVSVPVSGIRQITLAVCSLQMDHPTGSSRVYSSTGLFDSGPPHPMFDSDLIGQRRLTQRMKDGSMQGYVSMVMTILDTPNTVTAHLANAGLL